MTEEERKQQKELWKMDRIRERREEWEKIRNLGAGARLQYFWDYYKIVLVIAALVCFAVWLVFNVIQGIRTDTLLYVCILNSDEMDPDTEGLKEDYIRSRGSLKKMEEMVFDSSIYVDPESSGTSQQDVATTMKITAFVGAGSVDVFLAPPNVTQFEQKNGMYQPLDSLLTEEEKARLGAEGCLYYAKEPEIETEDLYDIEEETPWHPDPMDYLGAPEDEAAGGGGAYELNTQAEDGMHIYAVRVDQAGVLSRYPIYKEGQVWFSLIGNAPRTEEAVNLLHFLLGETQETDESS